MGKEERRVQEVMSEENTWQHVCIDRDKPVKTSAPSHPSGNCGQFCRGCDRVAFLNRWLLKNAEIAQWSILGRNKTNRLLADGHVTPLSALLTLIGCPPSNSPRSWFSVPLTPPFLPLLGIQAFGAAHSDTAGAAPSQT